MAVTSATSTTAAATSQSAVSRSTIANNFDTFLLLLTTQLKNQNPLDPLDTNQFTQQLVQFAGVEQQIRSNESLEALVNLNKTSQLSTAMSYVGATVTADGATSALKQGVATWYVTAPRAASATINVSDSTGNVVFTQETTLEAGTYAYNWDGKLANGQTAPEGQYTIKINAKDASGQGVTVSTQFSGVVDAVDLSGSEPLLMIGTALLTLDKIKTVQRPTTQEAPSQ
ncbi:MAG TPA: flagellar hook capping FlgD N-terminal domain-containing protein [Xanthobacteraceae bacterium]|nr:flagellar hook capping FlgD N-terminal domain-containing protein [Xanthobacteraceae bacterium]